MVSSLRLLQIRYFSKFLEFWGRTSPGQAAIAGLRRRKFANRLLQFLVGYRRTFASFAEAETYAAGFVPVGHEHADNITYHAGLADSRPRESDYPVLFYLAPLAAGLRVVFDLGGNVGNLFYALQSELKFSNELVWQVYDLPTIRSAGAELARTKNEPRLRFTGDLSAASGCDLFIASGSLHYFERPLAEMLASLDVLPRHLVINRTPCTREDGGAADLITVQDADTFLVPGKIHNPARLIESLRAIGYTLHASWPVYERRLWVPLYPEFSSDHYSGFYFIRGDSVRESSESV